MDKIFKILIISPNREKYPCPVIPLGALMVNSFLKKRKEDTLFIDLCFENNPQEYLSNIFDKYTFSVIIFSIRNIDNETYLNSEFFLKEILTYIDICRNRTASKIIIGGIGFSILPKEIFKYLLPDYGIVGNGFHALVKLISIIREGNKDKELLNEIEGLVFECDSKVVVTHNNLCSDISFEVENWQDIYSFCDSRYSTFRGKVPHPPIFGFRTNMGCKYQCIHCSISQIENKIQNQSIEKVIKGLNDFSKIYPKQNIFFVDNIFNANYNNVLKICEEMINKQLNINWTCYLHPKNVNTRLISTMKAAGCISVSIGADTLSDKLLRSWGKGFSFKNLKETTHICKNVGIPVFLSLIVGGWGETVDTLQESLSRLKEIDVDFIWGAWGVRVYPETKLSRQLIKAGVIKINTDFLQPQFYLAPDIETNGLQILKNFKKENPNMVLKFNTGQII